MCGRFPGSIIIRITNPFDKVFLVVMLLAVVKDAFYFEFLSVLDRYRIWRRDGRGAVCDGCWVRVRAEYGDVEDWVYLEGLWDVQFVSDRRDLLDDSIWANKAML